MSRSNYILVTAARNEAKNLPYIISSITNQSCLPSLWVIVDDNSDDGTPDIVKNAGIKYPWIKHLRLTKRAGYMGMHYSYVCIRGFEYARYHCDKSGIGYDYIGLLDADEFVEPRFFEKMVDEFEKDPSLGLASGSVGIVRDGDVEKLLARLGKKYGRDIEVYDPELWCLYGTEMIPLEGGKEHLPNGSGRLWSTDCFKSSGFIITYAPDSVSNIKAKINGYNTKRFRNIRIIGRVARGGQDPWKAHLEVGKAAYHLNLSPLFAIFKSVRLCMNRPYYIGLAYFTGFFVSWMQGDGRINDRDVREYYKKVKWREFFS